MAKPSVKACRPAPEAAGLAAATLPRPRAVPARCRAQLPGTRRTCPRLVKRRLEALLGRFAAPPAEQDVAPDAQEVGLEPDLAGAARKLERVVELRQGPRRRRRIAPARGPAATDRTGRSSPSRRRPRSRMAACDQAHRLFRLAKAAQRPGAKDLGIGAELAKSCSAARSNVAAAWALQAFDVPGQLEQQQAPGQRVRHDLWVLQPARERQPFLVAGARPLRLRRGTS